MVKLWQELRKIEKNGICWLCEQPAVLQFGLCEYCFIDLPRLPPRCCGDLASQLQAEQTEISACRLWCAALSYENPVTRWVQQYKYSHQPALADCFAPLMAAQVVSLYRQEKIYLPDALVPVPLGNLRWYKRGYNQAAVLAEKLGTILGIPVIYSVRRRSTRASHRLSAKERKANVSGAFRCIERPGYKRLAIIDDVITSGATVNAVAAALKAQQPCLIDAWAFAYTPKKHEKEVNES